MTVSPVNKQCWSVTVHCTYPQLSSGNIQLAKSNLAVHQRRRRQRELLSLLVNAVERLQHFETVLIEWIRPLGLLLQNPTDRSLSAAAIEDAIPMCTDSAVIRGVFRSVTAWLANASQLLHLITRDVDLCKAFEVSLLGSMGTFFVWNCVFRAYHHAFGTEEDLRSLILVFWLLGFHRHPRGHCWCVSNDLCVLWLQCCALLDLYPWGYHKIVTISGFGNLDFSSCWLQNVCHHVISKISLSHESLRP